MSKEWMVSTQTPDRRVTVQGIFPSYNDAVDWATKNISENWQTTPMDVSSIFQFAFSGASK